MMPIEYLSPTEIRVGERRRPVDAQTVAEIKRSIDALATDEAGFNGLINPLTVSRMDGGQPELICGMHRLLAINELGWEVVPCHVILTDDDKQKRLIEIAENYCHAELTYAQRAAHAKEYAELAGWHIGQSAGGRPRKLRSDPSSSERSSASKQLAKTASSRPGTVSKQIQVAKTVDGEVLRNIEGTDIDNQRELLALGKLPKNEQRKIAKQWANPEAKHKVKPTTIAAKQRRDQREHELAEKIGLAGETLGEQEYGVILADPPWSRETYSEAGKSRDPSNHYPTMTLGELEALPIPAAPDCILFMWSTGEHLAQALHLIQTWGFDYKSCAVWVKPKISTGYWFRTKHELVVVATRGSPIAPAPGTQEPSVFEAVVTGHSEKPDVVHEMIERLWPNTARLEMFARKRRENWDAWGAEA